MTAWTSQSDIPIHCSDPQDMVLVTNVLVHSATDSVQLPFHALLGTIHPFSEADTVEYQTAMRYTAQHLFDIWFSQVGLSDHYSHLSSEHLVAMPGYTSTLTSGLDSSLLSEFLDSNTVEHEQAIPPTDTVTLKPGSLDFQGALFTALELDTPSYVHVPLPIMAQFKELLNKYPHVFHLPNSPLSTIKGFFTILTLDKPLQFITFLIARVLLNSQPLRRSSSAW